MPPTSPSLASIEASWAYSIEPRLVSALVHISQLGDVGGMVGGKIFGKHSFFKRLSPNKTMEGFIGQMCFTQLTVLLMWLIGTYWPNNYYFVYMPLGQYMIFGLIV